jgi:hypothetical protein
MAVFVFLGVIWLALGAGDAFAQRRVALVVGNSEYKDTSIALTNPKSDASDIAATLKKLGFDVLLTLDSSTREMDIALKRFGDMSASADVALFFYAGHALQYQGNNYLMPIDASLDDEVDLRRTMVSDEQVRIAIERSSGVRIMILDACRTNPLAERFKRNVLGMTRAIDSTRGLARIDKAQGMVVAYAAAPGEVALDGNTTGRNSPFTSALIRRMQEPALEISTMFRRVTNDVWDETRGRQRPEYSSTLRNDYYLDPLADQRIWERIRDLGDVSALREFISQFPGSVHMLEAQHRMEILERARRERDEQARLDRERLDNDRVRREACQREADELSAIGNDFAKLQVFAQTAKCDEVRSSATERLNAIVAQRQEAARREEARRREEETRQRAERCGNEQSTVEALRNDLPKLQEFAKQATCDQARTAANERIGTIVAEREAENKKRQEAERVCRTEQQTLVSIWTDLPKLQAFLTQATCEQVRATASERIKTVVVERDRRETEARQQTARNCQIEQAAMGAGWDDPTKLQDLANHASCPEVRPALNERIARLLAAQREAQERQQAAAEKLARLEEERNRQRHEEEAHRRAEQERQQAQIACQSENMELSSIENDVVKLRSLAKRSSCEDVRSLTNAKVTRIEREEKACRDEDGRRSGILGQAKRQSERTRLASLKEAMIKLEQEVTCVRLRPTLEESLATIRVKIAQTELKRLQCFDGSNDGVMNDATRDAARLFQAKVGSADNDGDITESLLASLGDQKDAVCKPEEPPMAARPRQEKESMLPRKQSPVHRQPQQAAKPRATQRSEGAKPAAPRQQSAPSGGGHSVIGL